MYCCCRAEISPAEDVPQRAVATSDSMEATLEFGIVEKECGRGKDSQAMDGHDRTTALQDALSLPPGGTPTSVIGASEIVVKELTIATETRGTAVVSDSHGSDAIPNIVTGSTTSDGAVLYG